MGHPPESIPEDGQVFTGDRDLRFLALAIETLVQDMSPVGDRENAKQLAAYTLGDSPPPSGVPEYVVLEGRRLTLTNPPFLMAEIEADCGEFFSIEVAFDSDLNLLIDPPVRVTLEGRLSEVVETVEQMLAEIYRTRGRRLEMIDEGVVDVSAFAERR